ncbi:hypothetical protein K8S19_08715 [bacterium]|nr:hypothetical protein [bacterium]
MKKILLAITLIVIAAGVSADIPNTLNYQGRLMDSVQQPVVDGQYSVAFRLYTAESGGTMVWEEAQSVVTNNGYFNTVLGNSTALTPAIFNKPLWVGIQVGINVEMTPRQKLGTSAYAMTVADGAITTDKLAQKAVTDYWSCKIQTMSGRSTTSSSWEDVIEFDILPSGYPLLVNADYSCWMDGDSGVVKFRLNIDNQYYGPFEGGYLLSLMATRHFAGGFTCVVENVPAGNYTAKLQWSRYSGGGTIKMDGHDSLSIAVVELKK